MWVQVAGFLLLCFTAAFLSWPIWKAALRQRRRERWPKVTGTVLEQRMTRESRGITLDKRGRTWPLMATAVVVTLCFVVLVAALTPVIFQPP